MAEKRAPQIPAKTNSLLINLSRSSGNLGKVTNATTTWKKLQEDLSTPVVDRLTVKEFLKLSPAEQHKRKNVGYIVGGHFKDGKRKRNNLTERSILTFDIDQCSAEVLKELLDPTFGVLSEYEYSLYSTRSHTPEQPRVRVVVPLAKPIPKEQYAPLTRIIAAQIDERMETVDPVSFRPAQVMYLPSHCKDAEFLYYHNDTGRFLSASEHFETWPTPWVEYASLPISPRETALRQSMDKAPDPRTKHGIIGAWCRVYDIHSLIENHLSDVYVPGSENDRYSYADGHTRDGAVVYDDATYLYSYHGTDPCSGKLVNAWDCYRVHKFGHLDKVDDVEVAEGDITKLPSYKAMTEFARSDEVVLRESTAAYYDEDAIVADMLPDEEVASETVVAPSDKELDNSWKDNLERYETSGKYLPSFPNILLILRNDPRFRGCLGFNEFNGRQVIRKVIRSKRVKMSNVRDQINGDSLPDHIDVNIRVVLEAPPKEGGYGMKTMKRDIEDAISAVVSENSFHPVKDYLRGLTWDGKPRMGKLLSKYFRAEDNVLHEVLSRNFMVAAVQRIFEPGCKFDHVLILRGTQGIRKSGGLRALSGEAFFGELTTPRPEKRETVVEQLTGKWIVEIPELSQFARSEVEVLKSLFSAQEDHVRLAFGRGTKIYLRKNVFAGTSNSERFLKDDTGNRRFWPVVINGQVNTAAIERDRDQLWAEAYHEYLLLRLDSDHPVLPLGIPHFLADEVASIQEAHTDQPYEWLTSQIAEWLDTEVPEEQAELGWRPTDEDMPHSGRMTRRSKVTLRDVAELCLGRSNFDGKAAKDIVAAMKGLPNWHHGPRMIVKGVKLATYRRNLDDL